MKPPMVDLKKLRESAMREGMKLMGDPRVMKLMMNPRVQKVVMRAFQIRGEIQGRLDERRKRFARRFNLATRDDVNSLRDAIRSLESALQSVQSKVEASNGRHHRERS